MSDHMNLLREHFSGDYTPPTLPKTIFTAPVKLPPYVDLVALDIETYGILEDTEQTVFHPARMTAVDSVPRHKIVVCAALSWWTEDHSEIHSATFRWSDDTHRAAFYSCLNNLPPKATLCGMNLPFDLSVLRYVDPRLAMLIRIDRYTLDDLSIWNQLDSDVRPEHSLKALSTLFRKMDYEHMQVNAKAGAKAKSDTDANLILYNCADTEATLRGRQTCIENIIRQHGTEHPAFTPYMTEFRSDLLWITLHHTEAGAMFDRTALERLETKCARKATRLADRLYARNVIPCGKGSEKSIRAAVYTAMCDAGLIRAAADTGKVWIDPRVKLTDAAKELGTGKANIHLLLAVMPRFAKSRATIRLIEAHRHASKIIDTYTSVLLREPARGCDARGMAWASWFPVPGHAKDTSDSEGGTKQGRFAAKNPAIQTLPPPVQKCMVSRYGRDGILAAYDESQGELRQATLLSGDEAFMEAYENDIDNHVETARETWPELVAGMRDYDKKRQAGKRTNFLALYLGGPARLIEAMRADVGWEMTLPQAADIVHGFDRKHRTFRRWQHAMIDDVALKGFLLLPTGWKRTFLGGPEVAQMSYTNEIANCPVQTLFAQCVESAQAMILRDRAKHRWTFMMSAQIHDAIYIDCHKNCFAEVDACVRHWLAHPPLWEYLEAYYGRHVKLKVDCKIKYDGSKQ
jgi:DNA polymerase I-like protein with 3'-5' exonuclease and polymerase domains